MGYAGLVVLLGAVLWAAPLLVPWAEMKDDRLSVFLFLGVLPLVNALFDWVSLGKQVDT